MKSFALRQVDLRPKFGIGSRQNLYSFEHQQKCNVQLNWVDERSNFKFHRRSVEIRHCSGLGLLNVKSNHRCIVHQ